MASSEELELVTQIRERVQDLNLKEDQNSDQYLLRWICARDHNLSQAEEMLRNSHKWREENDIDNLHMWEIPSNILRDYPFVISGNDLEGCPVGVIPLGTWDVRKAVESGLREMYIKYVDHIMVCQFGEALKYQISTGGATKIIIILDMSGYSFHQVTSLSAIDTIVETVKRFDLNHPETLKLAIVINAPIYFSIAYEVAKRVMSAKTLTKVKVFGANPTKWQPFLLIYIPKESLPTNLGGTNNYASQILNDSQTNNDPPHVNHATETLKYQMSTLLHIPPGCKLHLNASIQHEHSILTWSIEILTHDIGFSIFNETNEVVSYQKYFEKTEGSIKCLTTGNYTLIFDNTHCRFRGKKVEYLVNVQCPS